MGDEKKTELDILGSKKGAALIRYNGIFDLQNLITNIRGWYGKHYYDIAEKEHTEAVKPSGKDLVIDFEAMRKVTDYIIYKVNVKIIILRSVDVLVETGQGKEKKQQAEVEIQVRSFMQKNYKNTFKKKEESKFQEFLRQVYERFIARKTLDDYKDKITAESLAFVEEIKEVLNVPRA